jgi:cation transport regulator ChaC
MTLYCFAYGSNMDREDLNSWCEKEGRTKIDFSNVSPAKLNGYKLSFNYFSSSRGAGVANIMRSDKDCVYGILIELDEESINTLRKKEGFPNCYDEINVEVIKFADTKVQGAKTYKVKTENETPGYQAPKKYYLNLIIRNAEKYGFPDEYIEFLNSLEAID